MKILDGSTKKYAWGTTDRIPTILGIEPTHEPSAEYWLGAHPAGPATSDGVGLDRWIADNPDCLGTATRSTFGDQLPFLVKLLSAAQALSLQVHPTAEQAARGFADEEARGVSPSDSARIFRDDWPKPELVCALERFEALCGFRDPQVAARIYRSIGGALADDVARRLETTATGPEHTLQALLESPHTTLIRELVAGSAEADPADDRDVALARQTIAELGRDFPDDPAIAVAPLLNHLQLQPFEAVFIPAGTPHSYLRGTAIEVMASSDNVLRGGLTRKHVDQHRFMDIVSCLPLGPEVVGTQEMGPGAWRYPTRAAHFELWRFDPSDDDRPLPGHEGPRVYLNIGGRAVLTSAGREVQLDSGQAVFISAGKQVEVRGDGRGFLTLVPQP